MTHEWKQEVVAGNLSDEAKGGRLAELETEGWEIFTVEQHKYSHGWFVVFRRSSDNK